MFKKSDVPYIWAAPRKFKGRESRRVTRGSKRAAPGVQMFVMLAEASIQSIEDRPAGGPYLYWILASARMTAYVPFPAR